MVQLIGLVRIRWQLGPRWQLKMITLGASMLRGNQTLVMDFFVLSWIGKEQVQSMKMSILF